MIVKKIEEIAKQYKNKMAVKTLGHSLTYGQLSRWSDSLAGVICTKYPELEPGEDQGGVALLFDHGALPVVGLLAALKAGMIYVPLDPTHPHVRLEYMLEHSGARIILTNSRNVELAKILTGSLVKDRKIEIIDLDNLHHDERGHKKKPLEAAAVEFLGDRIAYILYTSGSTGKPKGVFQSRENTLFFAENYIKSLSLVPDDRMTFLSSFSHDGALQDIYGALLSGATLYPFDIKNVPIPDIAGQMAEERITIYHSVPTVFRYFTRGLTGKEDFTALRLVVTGGEPLHEGDVRTVREFFPNAKLAHMYGQTESSVNTMGIIDPFQEKPKITIGEMLDGVELFLFNEEGEGVDVLEPGEIFVNSAHITPGYWKDPEATAKAFLYDEELGRLYRSGDLGEVDYDGSIRFLGRKDHQIKIRGFRVEPGEIETWLLIHEAVREAVVIDRKDDNGESFLCAYVVPVTPGAEESTGIETELRDYISAALPEYMIPSYFVVLEKVPRAATGKIDRAALPEPVKETLREYAAPTNDTEVKLVEIWSGVLNIPGDGENDGSPAAVGIDDNFFALGGHSLKATILVSRIQKEFDVEFPLSRVFSGPTIREFGDFVRAAKRINYEEIKPAPKREYYPQSSAQKRLFFLDRFEEIGTSYNMPSTFMINGTFDIETFEHAIKLLIHRHESLRTSFHLIDSQPVQKIHQEVEFEIEYLSVEYKADLIQDFVRLFDLSKPPLMRVGSVEISREEFLLLFDMHHIIGDGTSMGILVDDFVRLYEGEKLSPLDIQYKDFALWQNRLLESGKVKEQEDYWLGIYPEPEEIPVLNLPTDFPRPSIFCFEGGRYEFKLEPGTVGEIRELNTGSVGSVTLYMFLMAALNILLYKYTAQEDMVVGIGIMGRRHANLHHIIGMFVNSLALRHYPGPDKTCLEFLEEVKETAVQAFENQDLQFEELVDKVNPQRNLSRNPLFDVSLVVQNFEQSKKKMKSVTVSPYPRERKTSKFDLTLFADETGDEIYFSIEYCTALFRTATIERMAMHFLNVIRQMVTNPGIKIGEMDILGVGEKQQLIYDFNDTTVPFPKEKAAHRLFEEQAERSPDNIAAAGTGIGITYCELNEKSNRLANYLLYEKNIQLEDRVGILMDRTVNLAGAVLGVLKAGAVYVPLDPGFPRQRLKHMIDDAGIGVVISRGKFTGILNRLQWECPRFHTYLCVDSRDIHGEPEKEKSGLMDEKLWNYVGETAVDDITGGGWLSSYTGQPFTRKEMEEYGNNILVKLSPYLDREMRVLEIGCASGISMYRIAPKVAFYYGTDLSPVIIEKNRERVKAEGHQNIVLSTLAAHEIDRLQEKDFGLVIINSVIQAFHGHNYLRQVIEKCLALMGERGYFFIGDVMDQELKDSLIEEMIGFKAAARNREGNVKTKTDFSRELFVSRAFFQDLSLEIPGIRGVEFSRKIYTIENELTKFRYDVLITVDKTLERKERTGVRHKYQQDLDTLEKYSGSAVKPVFPVKAGNLAYIIYTSGTSGQSKGVMSEHRGMANLQVFFEKAFNVNPGDRVLQFARISFDASVWEIFMALFSGASLYFISEETIGSYIEFEEFLVKNNITTATLPPPYLMHLDPGKITSLRILITAGSETNIELVNKWKERSDYINAYGPTESTICATSWRAAGKELNCGSIPIGKPILNFGIYILDSSNRLQPVNVPGELCISGEGLGRGYLNQPELTAEKFFHLTLNTKHLTLYKTGDLARWLLDGNIEFLGRIDHQVKVRGYRIELGEIQTRLVKHDAVKEAVAIDRVDENGDKTLCAYIVIKGQEVPSLIEELRNHLSHTLPDYMLPSHFIEIDKIPLTPAGKVDRKALPHPGVRLKDLGSQLPRDELERKLAGFWSEVLGIEKEIIGIDANFFEIGGHSIKATILVSMIHKELEVKIPLAEIFKTPTIRGIRDYIGATETSIYDSIEPAELREYYPLSSAQERLFILDRFENTGTGYNMTSAVEIAGRLDKERYEKAFKGLIARHEALRTSFHLVNDEPVQVIHKEVDFGIEYYDSVPGDTGDLVLPFDLSHAPLLRVAIVLLEREKYLLLYDLHHIISDGTSMGILVDDFICLYEGETLAPLRIEYKDFACWQNSLFETGKIEEQENYWLGLYPAGEDIPVLNIPTDFPRPAVFSFAGSRYGFSLEPGDVPGVKALGSRCGATLYMTLMAAFNILLHKYTGQDDIIVGSGIMGRPHADLLPIIGMFVNSLAIRSRPKGNKTCVEFLNETAENSIRAFANQDVQFEDLVDKLNPGRDTSRNPIFDVSMVVQNFEQSEKEMKSVTVSPHVIENKTSKFDFTLYVSEREPGDGIYFTMEYCTALFKPATIQRLTGHFLGVLRQMSANPGIKIGELDILTPGEKQQLIFEFNDTAGPFPGEKTLHRLFAEQAERMPDCAALVGKKEGTAEVVQLTYRELNQKSGQLAGVLKEKGVLTDNIVAIMMERSVEMIIGILGILKAGGVYLPIDPDYPRERFDFMLKDSHAKILLSEMSELIKARDAVRCSLPPASFASPSNLAYIIYTSGSTGWPKGVLVRHKGVVNMVAFHQRVFVFETGAPCRMSQVASQSFDAMALEVWPCLLRGAVLYIAPGSIRINPAEMKEWLIQKGIIASFQPTAAAVELLNEEWPESGVALETLWTGGERLTRYPTRLYPFRLYNLYGPTEDTIWTTWTEVPLVEAGGIYPSPPIGKPIANHQVYILGAGLRLQPIGTAGEICIGGEGTAPGYLNQPELTAETFLSFSYKSYRSYRTYFSKKIYKTGDLGRWLPDGNIEFLGRIDHQVKIRGFRIETGEIEGRLLNHENIKEAVVLARQDEQGEKHLCAYIVWAGVVEKQAVIMELREHLAQTLPVYMIPAYFIRLEKIPLTPGGKIDRRALPLPGIDALEGRRYAAPGSDLEQELVEIWEAVLPAAVPIGIDDNFFEIGGHSLKAAVLAARINKRTKSKVPLSLIFQRPTVRALALYINRSPAETFTPIRAAEQKEYYQASYAQRRVWVLSQSEASSLSFNIHGAYLFEEEDIDVFRGVFHDLIERHESLRTVFLMIDGDVKQRILPAEETGFSPGYVDLRGAENREKKIRELVEREGNTLFDLLNGPLLRAKLVQVEEKKYWLLFTIHHIISDFLSMEVMRKEVGILYESLRRGETNPLGPLRTQYRDYTAWQNEQLAGGRQPEQLRKYWQGRLMRADNIPVLELPYEKMRPAVLSYRGETAAFTIPGKTAAELRTLAEENNATLFMVLLSSIYVFLFHYSGQTDIVIGTPVAGREHEDLENQIGYYLNTLPLRTSFREENTFIELLNMVRKVTLGAFEHQLYPFDRLVDELGIKRDMGRHPLFDVVVDMLNLMEPPGAGERVETQDEITFHQCRSKFDLTVYFIEEAESIGVYFEYSTDLFEKKSKTIERMVNRFRTLLADIIKNTRVPISNLQLQEVEEIPVPAFGTFARN